ncbi:LOW QUALITY PROTEIN: hypothetical protein Cgig2_005906 [Carnegiea gigantea]|uniref:Aminotransferase-like plant mobile domain-containing protein n=1 Tax=Carnegiea gigantea TaxID=171969 RepID=A0A9Q1K063_9CARY|nr:LOW QUALITY PROTEIN: hypothetical protein Cgig2_005906 [Carnegiea gigantea]
MEGVEAIDINSKGAMKVAQLSPLCSHGEGPTNSTELLFRSQRGEHAITLDVEEGEGVGNVTGSEYAPSKTGTSTEDTVSMVDESCEAVGGSSSEGDDVEEVHADSAKAGVDSCTGEGLGSPVTDKVVEFGEDDLSTTELVRMVRLRMAQYVKEKSENLKSEKGRKRLVFRNYINVMKKQLDANKEPEKLGLWLSLYAWRVMNRVMFLRTPYGAAWSMHKYMEDIHRMGEYVWAEAVWCILVEAIEKMQRKLERPVSDVQMNRFFLLIRVWLYEHTTRFAQHDKCKFPRLASWDNVDHGGRYDAFQLIEGIKESEGMLSYEERLERACEELRAKKGKHVDTLRMLEFWKSHAHELEARLKRCAAPAAPQDTRPQPGGDVGVDVQNGLDSMARAVTDVGEATVHEISLVKGVDKDATCQTTANIPGDAPQCSEPHVQPSAEVEDIGERADDVAVMPCREDDQQLVPEVRESGAMPGPHVGEAAETTDGPGPAVEDVYVGGSSTAREGECTPPASSAANVKDYTHATNDPKMQSLHHAPPTIADSAAADHEDGEIPGETKRTSPDADDVGCGDNGGGNSSNIVTHMRRKPRSRKPTVVHGSPLTDPTRLPGARKSKKDMNEGVTAADEPRAVDDPGERSVDPPDLSIQPLSVEGSSICPSVEDLNKIKLTKQALMNFTCMLFVVCVLEMCHSWLRIMQVLAGYISTPLSAMEMDLVTKCYFVLDMCADIDGQGGGHTGVSAEAYAGKLVTGPHPCGSKGGSRGQVTLHNKGRISGIIWDNFKATLSQTLAAKSRRELLDSAVNRVVVGASTVCFILTDMVRSMYTTSLTLLTMFACVKRIALVLTFLCSTTYTDAG